MYLLSVYFICYVNAIYYFIIEFEKYGGVFTLLFVKKKGYITDNYNLLIIN